MKNIFYKSKLFAKIKTLLHKIENLYHIIGYKIVLEYNTRYYYLVLDSTKYNLFRFTRKELTKESICDIVLFLTKKKLGKDFQVENIYIYLILKVN